MMMDRKLYFSKFHSQQTGAFVGMTELFSDAWDCNFATKNISSQHGLTPNHDFETTLKMIEKHPADYTHCRVFVDAEHRGHNPHELVRQIEREGVSDWKPQAEESHV